MRFSIVTPSYNQQNFIEDTIKSVLAQSYLDYEYIIIDGGSTDGTFEIVNRYKDRLKKYVSEPDEGQADAINKGFKYADGDIYAYLNSDDYYFEDTLEKVAEIFKNNPLVDVVYGDCVFTDAEGNFIRYFSEILNYSKSRLLNITDFIMQPSTFWRRSVFEKYGPFDKNFHYGFDWALWCEFAKNDCKFFRAPAVLSANRVYAETKTSSGGGERLAELKVINNKYKTTVLPHAYFGYAYAENKGLSEKSLWESIKAIFYFLISYRNIFSLLKSCESRVINGLYPRSGYMKKNARLCLPYYSKYSVMQITLKAPGYPNQSVRISNRGKLLGRFSFEDGLLEEEIDMAGFSGDVDVYIEFETEYTRQLKIREILKRPCAPRVVAAELVNFKIR